MVDIVVNMVLQNSGRYKADRSEDKGSKGGR